MSDEESPHEQSETHSEGAVDDGGEDHQEEQPDEQQEEFPEEQSPPLHADESMTPMQSPNENAASGTPLLSPNEQSGIFYLFSDTSCNNKFLFGLYF